MLQGQCPIAAVTYTNDMKASDTIEHVSCINRTTTRVETMEGLCGKDLHIAYANRDELLNQKIVIAVKYMSCE